MIFFLKDAFGSCHPSPVIPESSPVNRQGLPPPKKFSADFWCASYSVGSNDVGKAMGKPTNQRLVVNIIRHWGFTRFHHFELITVNLTGSKIQLLLVWEHCNMKGWLTSNYHVKCCCCLVILFFACAGRKRCAENSGRLGMERQTAECWHATKRAERDCLWQFWTRFVWFYCGTTHAHVRLLPVSLIYFGATNWESKHMRLTNMNNLTRCR